MSLVARACLLTLLATAWQAGADLAEIRQRGRLRVLAQTGDVFWTPAIPEAPGFDREVLEAFARLHKLELEAVEPEGWPRMIPALLEGRGDVLASGLADTPARRERVDFSVEVFPSRDTAFNRAPGPRLDRLELLRPLRVGTIRGTSMERSLLAAGVPRANLQYVQSGSLLEALSRGEVAAAALPIEHVLVARRRDPAVQLGAFLGPPVSLAYAVRKTDVQLRAALDDFVENLRRTQTWNRLLVKYLGADAVEVVRSVRGS